MKVIDFDDSDQLALETARRDMEIVYGKPAKPIDFDTIEARILAYMIEAEGAQSGLPLFLRKQAE